MSLWVPVGIKNAAFKGGLDQMRGQAKQFSGAVAGMFASAFAVTAIIAGFKSWMTEMDRVQKLGQRFGETAESIQRVGLASELAGADLEMAAKTAAKLTQAAGDAAAGNATLNAQFEAININASEFIGLSLEDKYIALSKAYLEAEGNGSKMVTFMKLLGEEGQNLIPLLAQGPEALQAAFDSASVASQGTIDSVAAFNDQLTILKQKGSIVFGFIIQAFRSAAVIIAGGIVGIKLMWDQLSASFMAGARGIGEAAMALAKGDFSGALNSLKATRDELRQIDKDTAKMGSGAADDLKNQWNEIWAGGSQSGNSGASQLKDDFEAAAAAAAKLAKIRDEIADIEKRNREAAMSDEEKLQSMIAERAELLKTANDTSEEGLQAKKAALELEGKIADAQEKAAKDKTDREKSHADKLAAAKAAEADVDEKNKIAGMSKDERRDHFRDKQKDLNAQAKKASKDGDELKATELRTQAKALESELRTDPESPTAAPRPSASIVATGLASAGGGGYVAAAASDPTLRATEKGNTILERIARAVETETQTTEQPPVK